MMARRNGEVPIISLVLAGVIVSSVFGALYWVDVELVEVEGRRLLMPL
jgi:hypothetical protein